MMKLKISGLMLIINLIILIGLLSSCGENLESPASMNDEIIYISSSIARKTGTKSYQESGKVEKGEFYLTYKSNTGEDQYAIGSVNFIDGTGFVTDPAGKELTWARVGYDASGSLTSSTFFLDNVPPTAGEQDNTVVSFDSWNPFVAGVFDDIDGDNDLLWGKASVERTENIVPIQLHHQMSIVRLEITVDNSKGTIPIDLQNATVGLTNLVHTPVSYNRLTGDLDLGSAPKYSDLIMRSPEETDWNSMAQSNGNQEILTYTTQDFVVPPQNLIEGENRPRLFISIPQGEGNPPRYFSGLLPRAMVVETGENSSVGMTLSFLKEHILTLRVTMNPDDLILEFMPVTVIEWVDKGTFLATGAQAAIFSDVDLFNLIKAYNEGNKDNIFRYGFQNNGSWIFNIYSDLSLSFDDIFKKMPVNSSEGDYMFRLNGQYISINLSDGRVLTLTDDNNGAEILKSILSGTYQENNEP